jgi:hypothetical protein
VSDERNLRHGSAHWPAIPPEPEPQQQDGTAADTSRSAIEYSPPGRGWRITALVVLIVLVFVGMAGAVLMFSRHSGGGR